MTTRVDISKTYLLFFLLFLIFFLFLFILYFFLHCTRTYYTHTYCVCAIQCGTGEKKKKREEKEKNGPVYKTIRTCTHTRSATPASVRTYRLPTLNLHHTKIHTSCAHVRTQMYKKRIRLQRIHEVKGKKKKNEKWDYVRWRI